MTDYLKLPALIGLLLGILGFASCNNNKTEVITCEYGVPSATYKVTGKVIDEDSREPVKGVRVDFYSYYDPDFQKGPLDSATTEETGEFELEKTMEIMDNFRLTVTRTSPRFQEVERDFNYSGLEFDLTNLSDLWYRGEITYDFGEITLKKAYLDDERDDN